MSARLGIEEEIRIVSAVREAEHGHRGEIVVHFAERCREDALARAEVVFRKLPSTLHDTAVVLMVAPRDRKVAVFAGLGVHGAEAPAFWKEISDEVSRAAGRGALVDGVVAAVARIGEVLRRAAPGSDDTGNELPDDVVTS